MVLYRRVKWNNEQPHSQLISDFADTVNNDSVHCLARFTPEDCILRLHRQKESHPVKLFDDKEPFEVFDIGIADLILKPVLKEVRIRVFNFWAFFLVEH